MRFNFLRISLLTGVALLALLSLAQAQESFFQPVSAAQGRLAATARPIPNAKLFRIDEAGIRKALANTAKEDERGKAAATIDIPLPDGTTERFALRETLVMSPEVAAANPTIKTYEGEGLVHKNYIIRMSLSVMGFEALIWGVDKDAVYFARTKDASGSTLYQSYFARDARKVGAVNSLAGDHHCGTINATGMPALPGLKIGSKGLRAGASQISNGSGIRTFRIAIATTGEWSRNAAGVDPTNPTQTPLQIRNAAYAVVITAINRVNGIYTRELACRFQNVNPNLNNQQTNIIFDNPNTDPYDNTDNAKAPNDQLAINQSTLDNRVSTANYDVGHLFGTGGGGVALSPSLCAAGNKAKGYSARGTDTGDPFVVDYFAHELGHQFAMGHTYNVIDQNGACTTRSAEEAYEVASGSTIMSYVGICNDGRNLQQYNDFALPSFHISSITNATDYLTNDVAGCGTTTQTNNIPTVSAGNAYIIPRLTPFTLTATGADADASDAANLSYSWEEYDKAPANGATGFGGTPSNVYDIDDDGVPRPILRAYSPVASSQRTFPSPAFILNPQNNATAGENQPQLFYTGTHPTNYPGATCPTGQTCIIGERLPTIARTMNFRVSVRDGKGGVSDAGTVVTVVNTSGAFRLTSFDNASAVMGNSQQTVTWNVVGTDQAPISCANVAIKLSTDGGITFPTTLLASTPNDGSEAVVIPNGVTTSNARLRVEAVGNIFFDISNTNFSITPVANDPVAITTQPAGNSVVCTSVAVKASVTVSGQPTGYQWYKNNLSSAVSGQTSATLTLTNVQLSDAGSYSVVVTSATNSVTSTAFDLAVNAVPANASLSYSGQLTCAQTSVTLTATATGATAYSLSVGQTNTTGQFVVSKGGSYTATISNASGCTATATSTVTSNTAAPTVSLMASSAAVCAPNAITLTASGSSTNVVFSAGATRIGMTNQAIVTQSGSYSVTVMNADGCNDNGCTATASINVIVNQPPAAPALTNANRQVTASGTPLPLAPFASATGSNTLSFSGVSGLLNPAQANVSQPGTQNFSVSQTDASGCTSAATPFTITVVPVAPVSQTVCRSSAVVISAVTSGVRYEWFKNGTSAPFKLTEIASIQRGTKTASLTIVSVQTSAPYYCKVFQANGSFTFDGPYQVAVNYGCIAPGARVATTENAPAELPLTITVAPNPVVAESLRAVVRGAGGSLLTVDLVNLQGTTVRTQQWPVADDEQVIEWPVSGRSTGLYLLRARSNGQVSTVKVVKQ